MTTEKVLCIWREDEDDPLIQEGLYMELSPNGTIKRHLIAKGKKIPLSDTTMVEELIQSQHCKMSVLWKILCSQNQKENIVL